MATKPVERDEHPLSKAEVLEIARQQKRLVLVLAFMVAMQWLPESVKSLHLISTVGLLVCQLHVTYKLALAVRATSNWPWLLSVIVPCVNLVAAVVLVEKGRAEIEAAGYKPGSMGLGVRI